MAASKSCKDSSTLFCLNLTIPDDTYERGSLELPIVAAIATPPAARAPATIAAVERLMPAPAVIVLLETYVMAEVLAGLEPNAGATRDF
eukprot:CAMPEP_0202916312 /NCGR_PEP_ID=MMETSP1392-20130828/68276_1 /ASSEMBLY_ACC=CAM_ASM_000868 /TAXON_ID=225041 /ORGANISM="Chlamydomonas chlamydogama, Strain SAG 11-48b" /LENGTH=88 /DNA_ID=CAMNT_0049608701 /DNA_START=919 /DNA_END=1185 /DNA_ORIENTATION=-